MSMTPAERKLRASIAGHTSWANTEDRTARTEPGRDAMWRKFEDMADPNHELTPAERHKRATNLRKAHFQRMSLKAAKARKARRGQ